MSSPKVLESQTRSLGSLQVTADHSLQNDQIVYHHSSAKQTPRRRTFGRNQFMREEGAKAVPSHSQKNRRRTDLRTPRQSGHTGQSRTGRAAGLARKRKSAATTEAEEKPAPPTRAKSAKSLRNRKTWVVCNKHVPHAEQFTSKPSLSPKQLVLRTIPNLRSIQPEHPSEKAAAPCRCVVRWLRCRRHFC